MIWGSRRRIRSRSAPMLRGLGALSRALGFAWRRSLQLRVVSLTLGLSLAVILVLGFVLTSQITDRTLEVKVHGVPTVKFAVTLVFWLSWILVGFAVVLMSPL